MGLGLVILSIHAAPYICCIWLSVKLFDWHNTYNRWWLAFLLGYLAAYVELTSNVAGATALLGCSFLYVHRLGILRSACAAPLSVALYAIASRVLFSWQNQRSVETVIAIAIALGFGGVAAALEIVRRRRASTPNVPAASVIDSTGQHSAPGPASSRVRDHSRT